MMRAFLAILAMLAAALAVPPPAARAQGAASGPALVLLVRHAESGEQPADDPGLTESGKKRADELVAVLHDAGVTSIVTSPFLRTRLTAAPLAKALDLHPRIVSIGASVEAHVAAVAAEVRKLSGVVLVVGHSNTIPEVIAALGGPKLADICDPVHDDLFVVTLAGDKARLVRARYGAVTADPACPK